jgi:TRAP-type C4-dicarboxylate transport system substrate-binding protein
MPARLSGDITMRHVHLLFAALVTAFPFAAPPAVAETPLKMNISLAQNSHYGVAIDTFAREVEKRTNGRYKIQNFYSGAGGAEREGKEGLQKLALDRTIK